MDRPVDQQIDDESFQLILQLAQEDLELAQTHLDHKGKLPEGIVNDVQLAINSQLQELKVAEAIKSDNRMAQSFAVAVAKDGNILKQATDQELLAQEDRLIARRLAGQRTAIETRTTAPIKEESVDETLLAKLAANFVSEDLGTELYLAQEEAANINELKGESSSSVKDTDGGTSKTATLQCACCRDECHFFEVATAPCGDNYCRDCLQTLFTESFKDQTLFPPRCHKHEFSPRDIAMFLTTEVKAQYEEKKIEYSTHPRTYCSGCGKFVRSEFIIRAVATCKACNTRTCTHCKKAVHKGECPEDPDRKKALELAAEQGWKECPGCGEMVELTIGCNHMTFVLSDILASS